MSETDRQGTDYRRKRVRRLKRMIVWLLVLLILTPNICCVFLFVQMHGLRERLDRLNGQVEQLLRLEVERQDVGGVYREDSSVPEPGEDAAGTDPRAPGQAAEGTPDGEAPGGEALAEPSQDPAHKVYLTFDDGPSANTGQILDILGEYGVKATFFVVGKEDEASREAIRRIVEEGHTLGMHSYSHRYSELYGSEEAFEADFHRIQDYLYELTGETCVYYRFPGGSSNTVSPLNMQNFADYLTAQGVTYYDWNIASGDGGSRLLDADTLLHNSTDDIDRWETSIVLMHDSAEKPTTVEALPEILERILAMEDTVILPITEETVPVQHIHTNTNE